MAHIVRLRWLTSNLRPGRQQHCAHARRSSREASTAKSNPIVGTHHHTPKENQAMSTTPNTSHHPQPVKKRKVRVFTWIILAINAIFAAWLIGGIASVS